jgi:predicted metal-dependent phosphoesterase TrpH
VIVRWGLDQLRPLLAELGIERPMLVASERWDHLELPAAARWKEIPSDRIEVPAGIDGIEVWHSQHDPELRRSLAELVQRRGLLATGGSDYHGRHKPDVHLGTGAAGGYR